jgi:hypothetical protein
MIYASVSEKQKRMADERRRLLWLPVSLFRCSDGGPLAVMFCFGAPVMPVADTENAAPHFLL